MSALILPVLVFSVGAAVEYANATNAQRKLTAQADSALLAGTRAAANARNEGRNDWEAEGGRVAEKFWDAAIIGTDVDHVEFAIEFTKVDNQNSRAVSGELSFSGRYASIFSGFLGRTAMLGNRMATNVNLPHYIDLTFLVDVSASMGIGATAADQNLMNPNVGDGCAFACHLPTNVHEKENFTPEAARSLGATLRMDVVRHAIQKALELIEERSLGDQVQVSIYSFSTTFEEVLAPTTDLNNVSTALADLDMVNYSATGPQQLGSTHMAAALGDLTTTLTARGNHGDGTRPNKRKSFVVVAGDGLENSVWFEKTGVFGDGLPSFWLGDHELTSRHWDLRPGDHFAKSTRERFQPFDPAFCGSLKAKDHTVYSAQIEYITTHEMHDSPDRTKSLDYIDGKHDVIRDAFSACASDPQLYVSATDPPEITKLFADIVKDVLGSNLRLVN